ncbi:hypothetical protein ACKC9G_13090 [Pokkaliibacter sp. CJK22405]|uniref:hypothetical protein n=1 Tax=Pokkaliibacter sp. CJK22405 TaxID=3384615 RepID=UPI0039848298
MTAMKRLLLSLTALSCLVGAHASQAATPPLPKAAYQAQADVYDVRHNRHYQAMVNANALVMRMKVAKPVDLSKLPGDAIVVVADQGTESAFMYPTGRLAPNEKMVMRATLQQASRFLGGITTDIRQFEGTPGQQRTIAGEHCREWKLHDKAGSLPDTNACLTDDGVLLSVVQPGISTPLYLVSNIERGPQAASLFMPPAGYQVMNVGGMLGLPGLFGQGSSSTEGGDLGSMLQNIDPSVLQGLLGQ